MHNPVDPQNAVGAIDASAPVRAAPPTVRGELGVRRAKAQRWPGILGTTCIVIGSLGLLMSAWGVLQNTVFSSMFFSVPGQVDLFAGLHKWGRALAIVSGFGVPVAVVLIIGGVLLFKRRPTARMVLMAWSLARIVQGAAVVVISALMQYEQATAGMNAAASNGAAVAAGAQAMGVAVTVLFSVVYAAWILSLPVFVLYWFVRPKVIQQVRNWPARSSAEAGA